SFVATRHFHHFPTRRSSDLGKSVFDKTASSSECPMHAQKQHPATPGKQRGCADLPCCNGLQATIVSIGKTIAKPIWPGDLEVFFCLPSASIVKSLERKVPPILGTGPPDRRTFAELVLQRSVLAHAPPSS